MSYFKGKMHQIRFCLGKLTALRQAHQLDLTVRRERKGPKWRWSTQGGRTFSLVYAMPMLQHQAQLGLTAALTAVHCVIICVSTVPCMTSTHHLLAVLTSDCSLTSTCLVRFGLVGPFCLCSGFFFVILRVASPVVVSLAVSAVTRVCLLMRILLRIATDVIDSVQSSHTSSVVDLYSAKPLVRCVC